MIPTALRCPVYYPGQSAIHVLPLSRAIGCTLDLVLPLSRAIDYMRFGTIFIPSYTLDLIVPVSRAIGCTLDLVLPLSRAISSTLDLVHVLLLPRAIGGTIKINNQEL